jgi:hypothetical protein
LHVVSRDPLLQGIEENGKRKKLTKLQVKKVTKLVLVYDLLWKNTTNEIPGNFPVFLVVLKQIKESSLHPWLNRYKLLKSKMENKKPQNLVAEMKEPNVAASEVHQDSTERIKCFKNKANVLFVENTIQENVFLFILQ